MRAFCMLSSLILLFVYSGLGVVALTAYKHGTNIFALGRLHHGTLLIIAALVAYGFSFLLMVVLIGQVSVPAIVACTAGLNIILVTVISSRVLREKHRGRTYLANAFIALGVVLMNLKQ